MQAIVSDIIVSQAAQSGNLLVSQTLNNSSSNDVSFAQILSSLNKTNQDSSTDEVQKTENPATREPEKAKPVDDAKDSDKTERIKDEQLDKTEAAVTPQENPKNEKLNSVKKEVDSKNNVQPKDEKSKASVNLDKEPSKTNQTAEKGKSLKNQTEVSKKNLTEEEKKEQLSKQNIEILTQENDVQNETQAGQAAALLNNVEPQVLDDNISTAKFNDETELKLGDSSVNLEEKVLPENEIKEKISVIDLRTTPEVEEAPKQNEKSPKQALKVEYNSNNSATVTMELNEQAASQNMLALDSQTAASNGSDFQAMVSNQLVANAPEFVKAGSVILQDNNKGTINLVLHPDDLGNVKIHLSMDGKTLSAHITVNTKEALEVFKENAQTLREAFAKNGFDTANFDVSYNGNSNSQNQTFEEMYNGNEYWARTAYNESLGGENDGYIPDSYEFAENSEYSINIVA